MDGEQPTIFAAVMVHGISVAEAVSTSSRCAKIRASERALEVMEGMLRDDFRLKFGCTCNASDFEGVNGTAV